QQCLVDVSLACEDKILTAHKLVLSAYSDYFKDLFVSMTSNNQYPVIFMNDVPSDVIQAILEFMYCGEVNIAQYNLNHFMKTARILKVKGLNIDGNPDDSQEEYPVPKRHSSVSDKHMSPPRKRMRSQKHYEHEFEGEEESHDSYQAYNAPLVGSKRRRSSSMSRESMKQSRSSLTRENMKQHRPSSNSSMVHEPKSFQASSNPAVAAMPHEMNNLHTRKKVKDNRPSQGRGVPPPQPALAISQVQENISNFDSLRIRSK
ncbi:UNVERIFIED_CONTAM: hypothetical protein GTU68_024600, partial [Idotea baltica]|nr:hypothetical protein [Idotea baltica]